VFLIIHNMKMKEKKIAIVSCYFQPNYGSQLQALATEKAIAKLGYNYETIKIDGLKPEINKAKYKYFLSKIFHLDTIKDKIGFIRKKVYLKLKVGTFGLQSESRNKKFNDFALNMFSLSKQINSKEELTRYCREFNAVLVGSDQLWLPSNIEADYYTLNFAPDNIKKIAYATSFGVSELPKKQANKARVFLNRIDYLSTREISGNKIIKDLIGKDVPIVCDPTLLFNAEEWLEIQEVEPIIKGDYIFCYFLGNNHNQRNFVRQLKKKTGCKIVQLQHLDEYIKSDENFPDYAPFDVGPSEYLNLIRNAKYICADSFHGTVFSILHHKPFFTFSRYKKNSGVSTNTRLTSILSILNLEHRFITGNENIDECMDMEIDYYKVDEKLVELRKFSFGFLNDALESIN